MNFADNWIEAYIGLGSNLDNPEQHVNSARFEICELFGVEEIAFSPLYCSKPVGPADQPDYINAVMRIKTSLAAFDLLEKLQTIESRHGRERKERWGARTLDLDLLLYGEQIITQPNLNIPHPEMPRRAFVLYPLADISGPELIIPGMGELSTLLASCPEQGIEKIKIA